VLPTHAHGARMHRARRQLSPLSGKQSKGRSDSAPLYITMSHRVSSFEIYSVLLSHAGE
jgi:hypothetical protein